HRAIVGDGTLGLAAGGIERIGNRDRNPDRMDRGLPAHDRDGATLVPRRSGSARSPRRDIGVLERHAGARYPGHRLRLALGLPGRDLIVLCAFCVVLGTLVIQGFTLRPLLYWLDFKDDGTI